MALIKCPECGKEISDKAKSCPKCGYPINYDDQLYDDESEDDYEDDEDNRPTISSIIAVILGLLAIILKSNFIFSVFGLVFIYDAFVNREFKRKLFIVNVVFLLIGFTITSRSDSIITDEKSSGNQNEESIIAEESVSNKLPAISEEEFKAQCNELDYEEVMRNPDSYIGQNIKVTVRVFESCKGGMFSSADTYYKTFTVNGNDDMIWVMDYRNTEDENYTKILDNDIVTVYGTFNGLGKTKNALNGSKSEDMKIDMLYAEISQ